MPGVAGRPPGGTSVTVALAVADPLLFVAVRVNVVVADTVSVRDVPLTLPMPGASDSDVAPVVAHVSVTFPALERLDGDAVNDAIVGAGTGGGGGGGGG